MFELLNSETGWLNLTNAILGLAVLVCVLAAARVMIQEIRALATSRTRMPIAHDDHAFNLTSLGITMADGGKSINEMARQARKMSTDPDEPQNIIRSDN